MGSPLRSDLCNSPVLQSALLDRKKKRGKLFICKPVNVATKLAQNSGKSSPMNTVLTQPEPITEIPTCNSSASTSTTTKPPVVNMSLERYLWIWNQEPWTLSVQDLTARFLDQTTLYSDSQVLETIGPRDITQKEPN